MRTCFRNAVEQDIPFIVSSWADSYKNSHAVGMIPMPLYQRIMRECIDWVMKRPGVEVWVAAAEQDTSDKSDILGWVVLEQDARQPRDERGRPLVHYVYVKQAYRRLGVAKALLEQAGIVRGTEFYYSCKTPVVSKIPLPLAQWAPLICRYPRKD